MKVVNYSKVKDFLEDNEKVLLENEAVNQLILINALRSKELNTNEELMFGLVVDQEDKVHLIFCNVKPFNLVISSASKEVDIAAINLLAKHLVENNIKINGVNANKTICDNFIEEYGKLTGSKFVNHLSMDIMELRELNDLKLGKGTFRLANLNDLELIIHWNEKFIKEATAQKIEDYEEFKKNSRSRIEKDIVYLFEDTEGTIVSMAVASRQLVTGVSISFVYTDENQRNKGYGLAVVYNLSKVYLERGNEFCTLFVDKINPISNRVYKKIGYRIIEDNYDYRIE